MEDPCPVFVLPSISSTDEDRFCFQAATVQVPNPNQPRAADNQATNLIQTQAEVEQVSCPNKPQAAVEQDADPNQEWIDTYLLSRGYSLHDVPHNGHCLLHAVIVSLKSQGIDVSLEQLVDMLCQEITENVEFYKDFSGRNEIVAELKSYIQSKNYASNTADILLNVLCNAKGLHAVVYLIQGSTITDLHQSPRQESNMSSKVSVQLALQGTDGNAHYMAVVHATSYEICHGNDVSKVQLQEEFSPEKIAPLPREGMSSIRPSGRIQPAKGLNLARGMFQEKLRMGDIIFIFTK